MSQDKKVANTVTPPTQTPRRSTVLNNVLLNKKSDYFVKILVFIIKINKFNFNL